MAKKEPLGSQSLVPFETTAMRILAEDGAIAILKFAALFSKQIYLSDTVLGDHHLFIDSYARRNGGGGLYHLMRELVNAGILKALIRDRVVVRGNVLADKDPTLMEIYQGWQKRDQDEYGGVAGFTTAGDIKDARLRLYYYEETDNYLRNRDALLTYSLDATKQAFRNRVRAQLDTSGSSVSNAVGSLPEELRRSYQKVIEDEWFTYAEIWRLLRPLTDDTKTAGLVDSPLTLHAHLNQFCLAQTANADQSTSSPHAGVLAAFSAELQRGKSAWGEVTTSLVPPPQLEELLEQADITLNCSDIDLISQLTFEEIVSLRERGKDFLEFPGDTEKRSSLLDSFWKPFATETTVDDPGIRHWIDLDEMRVKYIKVFDAYIRHIAETIDRRSTKGDFRKNKISVFIEKNPTLMKIRRWDFAQYTTFLLNHALSFIPGGSVAGQLTKSSTEQGVRQLTAFLLQTPSEARTGLGALVPPNAWKKSGTIKI